MWLLIVVIVILFFIFIKVHSLHKKPIRVSVVNMLAGVISLALIAPVVSATVNIYTVFTALTLGVPGVALITLTTLFL